MSEDVKNYSFNELFSPVYDLRQGRPPWWKRLFFKDEEKFSRAELKRIRKIVREQLNSSEPWLNIDGIVLPKPGHVFRLKADTRYTFTLSGSSVFVKHTWIHREMFTDPESDNRVDVLPLDPEGRLAEERSYCIRVKDLEEVSKEGIEAFLENQNKPRDKPDVLYDGEAVELVQDVFFKQEVPMEGAASDRLLKGLNGVIDNPDFRRGASLDDINDPHKQKKKVKVQTELRLISGGKSHELQENCFRIPLTKTAQGIRYDVYIPTFRTHVPLLRSQLQRRSFDKEMFNRVVMDEETREYILSLIHGKEEDLQQWGIEDAFRKGRGKIFLAYGPPGTGKTMTGEAVAEVLEKPLYIADSTSLGGYDPKSFEQALKDIIEKTERWNSLTLIDEAEGILLSRDVSFNSSARVEAVLRNLEELKKGILWLTTNRPVDIDFAIQSRIRAQIYFKALDAEKRRKVWQITLPKDMPVSDLIDSYLDQLAEVEINGREIRNAIINAAERARYEKLDHVPAKYLLAAAQRIFKNHEVLEKAQKENARGRPIGFETKK